MAHWCCSLTGLLACAALCAGCATNRPGNPFGSTAARPSKSQMAAKKSATGAAAGKSAASDPSVAQTPAKAQGPGSSIHDAPETAGDENLNGSGPRASGDFDPETLALIDRELRDAPPEERAAYLADFKKMAPATIRQVLRSRRMASRQEWASNRGVDPRVGGSVQTAAADANTGGQRDFSHNGVQNVAGVWDGHASPGNRASPSGGGAENGRNLPQDAYTPRGTSPVPVGHNTGYRLNNAPDGSGPQNRAGPQPPVVNARPNSAGNGQASAAPQYAQLSGTAPAPGTNAPNVRPAMVTIGAPVTAGEPVADTATDTTSRAQLARLISVFEAETAAMQPGETEAEKLEFIKKHVELRRLYLNAGQQERALQAIPGIDPADQEFWQQQFWGETNYFDVASIPSSADRASQTVAQMQNAIIRLQEKAHLELRNVSFCHRISSFGNYEKYSRDEFSPGQEVLLYAEVANIHSEPIPDGKFRTSLKSTLDIYRHGQPGEPVERINLPEPETTDICRTHRRDYFHSYQFAIPAKVSAGPHVLKLTVEDQISRRVTTYALNFMVK